MLFLHTAQTAPLLFHNFHIKKIPFYIIAIVIVYEYVTLCDRECDNLRV